MSLFRTTILDHRNQRCTLHSTRSRAPLSFTQSGLPPEAAARIRQRLPWPYARSPHWGMGEFIQLGLLLTIPLAFFIFFRAWDILAVIAIVISAVTIVRRLVLHLGYGSSPMFIRAFLAERRCPSCAYDLAGTSASADRLTVCPECGAAWAIPEPDSPAD